MYNSKVLSLVAAALISWGAAMMVLVKGLFTPLTINKVTFLGFGFVNWTTVTFICVGIGLILAIVQPEVRKQK